MNIETIVVGPFEVNCFIIGDESASAIIIDPGADAENILHFLNDRSLVPVACLLTHGHADHISAAAEIADKTGTAVYLHHADQRWAFSDANSFHPFYPKPREPQNGVVPFPRESLPLIVRGFEIMIIHTPGHTPGSVCFSIGNPPVLFSGDTLFAGSVGRTDLEGGNAQQLALSLRRLSRLPDSTLVHPGHGPATTIGAEKQANFFLRSAS